MGLGAWHVWLDGGVFIEANGTNFFTSDSLDYERSTGRLLQPGEKLHVTFEN